MNPGTEAQVLQQVKEQDLIHLASELIKIPSFKPDETPVAHFLADYFRQRDYQVDLQEVEPGRLQTIATLKGAGGGKTLMFNGHTDINSVPRQYAGDPWTPVVEGDHLYGHGVENMKGGLASMIIAAEAIRRSGVRLKGDLVLACVVGETQGGEGTVHLLDQGLRPDMAVFPEPSGVANLVTVHGGIVHLAIHTYGVTGHISRMESTINAVYKMARVIDALQGVEFTYDPRPDLPALPRLNVGSVIGGRGREYVLIEPPYIPDLCTIIVDVHFVPGQTVDSIVADIRVPLDRIQRDDSDLSYEIEIPPPDYFKGRRRLVMQPLDVPRNEYIVETVASCHQRVTGNPPEAIGAVYPISYSAGDTAWLWQHGIPCLLYGPASGHFVTAGEGDGRDFVSITEMAICAKTLALTALEVCNLDADRGA